MQEQKSEEQVLTEKATEIELPAGFDYVATIGSGAYGLVVKAFQKTTHRHVTIKFLQAENFSEEVRQRFHREAQILASLDHPNIQRVLGFGFLDGYQKPYIINEYLEGENLEEKLARQKRLDLKEFAEIFPGLADACAFLHQGSIVHRDIKPANIILARDEASELLVPKLIDFGMAKLREGSPLDPKLTQTGAIIGTPAYMSPEQCQGKAADSKSDIFSLACIMYECLAGSAPWQGENAMELIYKRSSEEAPTLGSDTAPEQLQALVKAMLSKDSSLRPDALHVSKDLKSCIESVGYNQLQERQQHSSNPKKYLLLGVTTLVLLALSFAFFFSRSQNSNSNAKPTVDTSKSDRKRIDYYCQSRLELARDGGYNIENKLIPENEIPATFEKCFKLTQEVLDKEGASKPFLYSANSHMAYLYGLQCQRVVLKRELSKKLDLKRVQYLRDAKEVAKINGETPPSAYSASMLLADYYFGERDLDNAEKLYAEVFELKKQKEKEGKNNKRLPFEIPDNMPGRDLYHGHEQQLNLRLGEILVYRNRKEGSNSAEEGAGLLKHVINSDHSPEEFRLEALVLMRDYYKNRKELTHAHELDDKLELLLKKDREDTTLSYQKTLSEQTMNNAMRLGYLFHKQAAACYCMYVSNRLLPLQNAESASEWRKKWLVNSKCLLHSSLDIANDPDVKQLEAQIAQLEKKATSMKN